MSVHQKTALAAATLAVPVMLGAAAPAMAQTTPDPAVTESVPTTTTTDSAGSSDAVLSAAGTSKRSARAVAPSRSRSPYRFGTVKYSQWYAFNFMQYKYGWGTRQRAALRNLWNHESGWNHRAHNGSSGAHGIPQALPGSKMAASGPNWRSNPETQIKWGLSYIKSRYGTPNGAWRAFQSKGWY